MIKRSFISESTWWGSSKTPQTLHFERQGCMVGRFRVKDRLCVRVSNSGLIQNFHATFPTEGPSKTAGK